MSYNRPHHHYQHLLPGSQDQNPLVHHYHTTTNNPNPNPNTPTPPFHYPVPPMFRPTHHPLPHHHPPPSSIPHQYPSHPQHPPHPDVKHEVQLGDHHPPSFCPPPLLPQHPQGYERDHQRHAGISVYDANVFTSRPPPPRYVPTNPGSLHVPSENHAPFGQFMRFEYQVDPSRVRKKKAKAYKSSPKTDLLSFSNTEASKPSASTSTTTPTAPPGRQDIHPNHPLYRSPGSVPPASTNGVAASVPTYTHSYLNTPRAAGSTNGSPPQAQTQAPAQNLQPPRASARRMSSSTSQSRGKSGFLGALPPAPTPNGQVLSRYKGSEPEAN